MHGEQNGVCVFGCLKWSTRTCIALGVTRQPLEFLVAPRVAEHDFMSSSREDRPEFATHQPGSQNANSHVVPLSVDQFLQFFRVPFPLHGDLRRRVVDLAEIVGRKFDGTASDVLFQTMQLRRTRDRDDPRLLREQPGKCDLSRRSLLPFCNLAKQINQCLICFPSLWGKARDDVAEVGALELCILVDLSGEEALTKRTEWNESDPEFLEGR